MIYGSFSAEKGKGMNVRDLPFEKANVRVLRFDPWSKQNKDADFIFEFEGEAYRIRSPYDWRSKKIGKGALISVEKSFLHGEKEKAKLLYLGQVEF